MVSFPNTGYIYNLNQSTVTADNFQKCEMREIPDRIRRMTISLEKIEVGKLRRCLVLITSAHHDPDSNPYPV
jgi:hypothetical protein